MADEGLLEYLHFELVNYCVNDKKVRKIQEKHQKNIEKLRLLKKFSINNKIIKLQ